MPELRKSFTPYRNLALENRPEQAPISSPEARFISRPVHASMIPAVRYSKNADSAVLREKTIISPRNASASEWTLPRILKIKISRDTKPAILRELRKGKVRPYELQLARALWKKGANNIFLTTRGCCLGDSVSPNLSTAYSRCLLRVVVSEILSDTRSY